MRSKRGGNLYAKLGYVQQIKNNEEKALELYEKAYAKGCTLPDLLSAYGLILLRHGDYEKAHEVLRYARTLKLDVRQWGIVYQNLGLVYWKMGRLDHAVEIYKKIFEKTPTTNVYSTLGFLLIAQGDQNGNYDEALEFNQRAYEYDEGSDASIADNMGQVLYRLGWKDEAESYFMKALELNPTQFDTLFFVAKLRIEQGKREEAHRLLTTALEKSYSTLNTVPRECAEKLYESMK